MNLFQNTTGSKPVCREGARSSPKSLVKASTEGFSLPGTILKASRPSTHFIPKNPTKERYNCSHPIDGKTEVWYPPSCVTLAKSLGLRASNRKLRTTFENAPPHLVMNERRNQESLLRPRDQPHGSAGPPFPRPNLLPRAQPQTPRPKSILRLLFRPEGAGTRGQCPAPASPGVGRTGREGLGAPGHGRHGRFAATA